MSAFRLFSLKSGLSGLGQTRPDASKGSPWLAFEVHRRPQLPTGSTTCTLGRLYFGPINMPVMARLIATLSCLPGCAHMSLYEALVRG